MPSLSLQNQNYMKIAFKLERSHAKFQLKINFYSQWMLLLQIRVCNWSADNSNRRDMNPALQCFWGEISGEGWNVFLLANIPLCSWRTNSNILCRFPLRHCVLCLLFNSGVKCVGGKKIIFFPHLLFCLPPSFFKNLALLLEGLWMKGVLRMAYFSEIN